MNNSTQSSGRRGRRYDQIVAPYGSRMPRAGDRLEEARILIDEEVTWT
jgi:hypothetical protein